MFPVTIKKRSEFIRISKEGHRAKTASIISICLKNQNSSSLPMVGYTASKKVGNAVARNKAKRRFRSLVRSFCSKFDYGYSFVFIATTETVEIEYSRLESDFLYCVKKSKERVDSRVIS